MSAETRSPSASPSANSSDSDASPANKNSAADGKPKKCRFNDCDNLAVDGTSKCAFHKNRRQCCVENCTNQVYARKLCVRHGGKKQCQADNCEAHARGGGFCLQHGGFVVKRFCIVEGCSKQAHARQKCFSLRTPLGNSFPTPRSHEFSLLMGLPSPQIDNSQLPSVLAMTNSGANATSSGQRTPGLDSFLASGPPSVSRGNCNYLSLGLFPTPRLTDRTPGGAEDAMMSDYIKLMGPDTPMNFHHHGHFGGCATPLLENLGNVFEHNQNNQNNANNAPRNHMAAMAAAAAVHGNSQQRMKMDFLSPRGLAAHNFQSQGFPTQTSGEGMGSHAGSSDYAAQFFVDNKNDKTRGHMKTSSVSAATTPTPKPTGVTAA
ncbi:hypothetical protein JG688_00010558 [Phytophthora aleatoria]|uniref:Uncharacterized protein n=1 Tax=Phytophthora aleatoria TaxID=2496075 RepID=A0A8J5IEI9_9STRA|nr:hypothetical protein JG688_00010558 [Phytophthora aleatoria]